MATSESASACENKSTKKPYTFSESEIEAAEQLMQLISSGDSEEDRYSSINSCSYSMVKGKQQHHLNNNNNNKVDSGGDVASSITVTTIEDIVVLAEAKDHERFGRRKNKRYRYIEELYSATKPVSEVKVKKMKYRK